MTSFTLRCPESTTETAFQYIVIVFVCYNHLKLAVFKIGQNSVPLAASVYVYTVKPLCVIRASLLQEVNRLHFNLPIKLHTQMPICSLADRKLSGIFEKRFLLWTKDIIINDIVKNKRLLQFTSNHYS